MQSQLAGMKQFLYSDHLLHFNEFHQLKVKTKKHPIFQMTAKNFNRSLKGAQWFSGRVLDSRPRGCGFEPHWRHCVGVLEQDTFILA